MTAKTLRVSLLALVAAAAVVAQPVAHAQDWKPDALASFDDAWKTINDNFYDPTFGGLDWKGVRDELRPKAEAATSLDGVRAVITEMLHRLKMSHFVLLPAGGTASEPPIGEATVPVDVRIVRGWGEELLHSVIDGVDGIVDNAPSRPYAVITHVDAGSAAASAGVEAGAAIGEIDGVAISTLVRPPTSGASEREQDLDMWRRVMRLLHGPSGSVASIHQFAADVGWDASVPRAVESGEVVTLGNLPPLHVRVEHRAIETPAKKHVGYIAFNVWLAQVDAPFAAAVDEFRSADGIVIDLRGNPGGLAGMIMGIAGQFLKTPDVIGTMRTRQATLQFKANPRMSMPDGRSVDPYGGKVAILVDELTGSASECFAAGLQSLGRVRVFGRQTMGAALPASTKVLPDGDVLMYVLGDFVTSTGQRVEGPGVTPNESIALTPAAFRAAIDPDLAAALAWVDGKK